MNVGKFTGIAALAVAVSGLMFSSRVVTAAQDRLTDTQMEELVAKASTPADHARLRAHFLEMAAIYTADADAHALMAEGYRRRQGNGPTDGDPASQADRIAQRAREAAATARQLVTYHERLAAGLPKSEVQKAPMSHPGLPMTAVQVHELIVNARTPAEHVALRKQFDLEAVSYASEANRHAAMAAGYRRNTALRDGDPAIHCDRFVQQMRDAGTAARVLSNYHAGVAAGRAK
jgi:hypothetical protein